MEINRLSTLTKRISGPGARAWDVGDVASRRILNGEDIIHLGIGDPDLDTPDEIQSALFDAIKSGKTHYAPLSGEMKLRETIAEHACGLYGGTIDAKNVIVCNGAQGALFQTFLCLTEVGDEVIVLEPYYATYPAVVTAGGAKIVTVALDRAEDYRLDIEKIKNAATARTKAIIINSPNNPAGTVFNAASVTELAYFCKQNDIWLITDEVYWSLCFDGNHISPYMAVDCRSHIIVINSLSKSHAMTGWRLGWAIGPDHFIKSMTDLMQAAQFGINQFVQNAAITALKDQATADNFNMLFKSRRDALVAGLRKSNHLSFSSPRGGMFILLDISATGLGSEEFAERLLEDEKVAVVPGFGFGKSVKNTVRIGFLCDEERLKDAAKRIIKFTDKLISV